MPLSNDQIKEIVRARVNEKEVQAGISHQNRLRFHTETILKKFDLSPYYREFLAWIGARDPEILAPDKFARFEQLIKAPIQTIELTESIFSRLFRIFYSQDAYFNYRFTDDSLESDWAEYRDAQFWQTVGFEAMQTAIDSVWIADLPAEQLREFPEPKNRLIDIENVLAIENDHYNNCKYVVFKLGEWVYVYDELSFRAFEAKGYDIIGEPVEAMHDLGYAPARMFWSENLTSRNLINKESPITKELTDLDWLLFHQTSKRYLDLANAYPTVISYEADDDYEDDDKTENEQRRHKKRPEGNRLMGPGSFVQVPVPREGESDMMANPMKIISPDVPTLEWHVKEETRLTDKIFKAVVGVEQQILNDAPKNETQIFSSYETQKSVLMRVKKNFEVIHKFADETLCRLRYGERFIGCEIDYGTNFFLKDVRDLQDDLADAKKSGASETITATINNNILNTQFREDKYNRARADIIDDLDPLPGRTLEESIEIYKNKGIDKINFIIKSNLLNFVKRFEREQTDIVKFGSLTNYNRKITQILESFKAYAEEMAIVQKPNILDDEIDEEASGDIREGVS